MYWRWSWSWAFTGGGHEHVLVVVMYWRWSWSSTGGGHEHVLEVVMSMSWWRHESMQQNGMQHIHVVCGCVHSPGVDKPEETLADSINRHIQPII